jgi:agmatine deiminase
MTSEPQTPREQGFRMPAEWEPHQATWVSWPHKEASWPGKIETIKPVFARMVAELSRSETVHINVNDDPMEAEARKILAEQGRLGNIVFHRLPTNDAWCRDHGAIFVKRNQSDGRNTLCALDWKYNAWGDKYPPYDLDNRVPAGMAEYLKVPRIEIPWVLEGGSIDVNGQGVLLTTQACLLNPNRNPELSQSQIEQLLKDHLGVEQILWLGEGIVGDDTDGHIDDITRFVSPRTVVTAIEPNPEDENHELLAQNLALLHSFRLAGDQRLKIVELPMPDPVECEGQRLPASYANFSIANTVVLLPFYGGPKDEEAREMLQSVFPDRRVIGIDCTDLIWGLGAFHCLTQQVPVDGEQRA